MKTYTQSNAIDAAEGYYWFKEDKNPWRVVSVDRVDGYYTAIQLHDCDTISFSYDGDSNLQYRSFVMLGPLTPPDHPDGGIAI